MRAVALLAAILAMAAPAAAVSWKEIGGATRPSARSSGAAGFDVARDRVIVFGGEAGAAGFPGETWELSLVTGQWTQLTPASTPTPRMSMAYAGSPSNLYVHGGTTDVFNVHLGDLWRFDYAAGTWFPLAAPGPPPRFDHNGLWDPQGQRFIIYGGFQAGLLALDDLWAYAPGAGSWTLLPAPGAKPAPRTNAFFATAGNGTLHLYGGHDDTVGFSDNWAYDLVPGAWRTVAPPSSPPANEHQASLHMASGLLYQWSGDINPIQETSDLWVFDPAATTWTDVTALAGSPPPRRHTFMAVDAAGGRAVAFGGYSVATGTVLRFDDAWVLSDLAPAPVVLVCGGGPASTQTPEVRVFEASRLPVRRGAFTAYGTPGYGVNVAASDLQGDGSDDVVTGPGPSPVFGPHVRAFRADGTSLAKVSFYAYGTLKYGVRVACGDLEASDAAGEILTGAGPGAVFGPHVRGFDFGGTALPGLSFYAYGSLRYGVVPAGGDLDGAGRADIGTGPGPSPSFAAHVRGFRYTGGGIQPIAAINFFAPFVSAQYGAEVALPSVDGDPGSEIAVLLGRGATVAPTQLLLFDLSGGAPTPLASANVHPGAGGGRAGALEYEPAFDGLELVVSLYDAAATSLLGYRNDAGTLVPVPELTFPPFATSGASAAGGSF